ncbi:hypothetical protein AJ87_19825 [Rhizobium yanglingense]|nr:hypothetical protein AJ87_19825 [Rhizobium yanglingense]
MNASNETILRANTKAQLFELVCEAAVTGGKFTSVVIALAEPDSEFLRVAAATGPSADAQRHLKLSTSAEVAEGRGLTGTAFRTGQPCISNDYLADDHFSAFHDIARTTGTRSGAALPLLSRARTAGILLFLSAERETFTPEFVELLQRLAANISFALENFDRAEEKLKAEARIKYLATHDSLTDLPNRAMFGQLLDLSVREAQRYQRKSAILFIDLDRFKIINDTLGHAVGDVLLIEMAKRFRDCVRDGDVVARLGGDEFVVLLNEITESQQVATFGRNLLTAASMPLQLGGHECSVTASIGVAMFPDDGADEQTLMKMPTSRCILPSRKARTTCGFSQRDQNPGARSSATGSGSATCLGAKRTPPSLSTEDGCS